MSTTIGQIMVELQANTVAFAADMAKARRVLTDNVTGMRRSVDGMQQSFDRVRGRIEAVAGAIAAFGAAATVRTALQFVADLGELGEAAGVTSRQIYALQLAGVQANISAEQLQTGMQQLTRRIGEARDGGNEAIRSFQGIGIAILDASGKARPTIDVLREVAQAIASADTEAEKAKLAFEVFGKVGQKMLPLLSQGAKGIDDALNAVGGADIDRLSKEFDVFFDKLAENAMRSKVAIAEWVSTVRSVMGDKALLGAAGAIGGGAAGFVVGGPIGAAVGAGAGAGMMVGMLGDGTREADALRGSLADVNVEMERLQKVLARRGGMLDTFWNRREIEQARQELSRLSEEAIRLKMRLDEVAGALSTAGSTLSADLAPKTISPVSEDEIKRLGEARTLLAQLNAQRQAVNRPDAVGLGASLRAQEEYRRASAEQIKALREQGVELRVVGDAGKRMAEGMGGDSLIAVRKFTDATVDQAVGVQRLIDGMKQAETVRQVMNLVPQIEAAKQASVRFNELTGSYEVSATVLETLRKQQELMTGAMGFSAERAQELATVFVDSGEAIKRSLEGQERVARLAQSRRDTTRQTQELLAQADAARQAKVEFDSVSGTYRVSARELEALRKEQELLNAATDMTAEEARRLAGAWAEANEKLSRATDATAEQARRLNDAAGDFSRVIGTAFEDAILRGDRLRNVLGALAQDIARIALRISVTKPLENWLGGAFSTLFSGLFGGSASMGDPRGAGGGLPGNSPTFGGPRASGGPVSAGTAYLVGEEGPELFVPRATGAIVPNGAAVGGGGPTINIAPTINVGSGAAHDRDSAARLAGELTAQMKELVQDQIRRAMRPGGVIYSGA